MCAVSAIYDTMGRFPVEYWVNPAQLQPWQDILKQAQKFDEATGQPDCVDPQKEAIMGKILARLEAIEKKLGCSGDEGKSTT